MPRQKEKSIVLVTELEEFEKAPGWWRTHWLRLMLAAVVLAAITVLLVLVARPVFTPTESPIDKNRLLYNDGHYTELVANLRQYVLDNPLPSATHSGEQGYDIRLLLAQSLVSLQQSQPAAAYLRELLTRQPNDSAVNFWLGRALFIDQKYDEAEAIWKKLIDTGNPEFSSRSLLGLGEIRLVKNKIDEAKRYVDDALKLNGPLDPTEANRAYYLSGLFLLRDTRFVEARAQFEKALASKATGKWQNNGPTTWAISQANERIRQIINTLPDNIDESEVVRRTKAGYALLSGEEYGLAEEQFVRVLQLTPNFIDAQSYLASIYWRTGRVLQSQSLLYTVLKADPNNRFAREVFIQLLTDQLQKAQPVVNSSDQVRQAREFVDKLLQDLIRERPDDALLQTDLARFELTLGQYQNAEAAYIKALELNDKKPVTGLNVPLLLLQLYTDIGVDPCKRGALFADRVLRDFPNDPDSWYWAGMSSLLCGKANLAVTQFQKALDLRPFWPLAVYRLGIAHHERGDIDAANRAFDLATDLEPTSNGYEKIRLARASTPKPIIIAPDSWLRRSRKPGFSLWRISSIPPVSSNHHSAEPQNTPSTSKEAEP